MATVHFAHITDTHIAPTGTIEVSKTTSAGMRAIIAEINARPYNTIEAAEALVREINALPVPVDFVLHTGDVLWNATTPEDYSIARRIFSQLNVPIYYLRGNVDLLDGVQRVLAGHSQAQAKFDYTFTVNGVRIACLDSNDSQDGHGGYLTDQQLDWLRTVGAEDTLPLIVALHHNPFPFGARLADAMTLSNGEALHDVLRSMSHRLRGVFYGHIHQSMDVFRDGILYSCAASALMQFNLWVGLETSGGIQPGALPGFSVVSVTDDSTFVHRVAYSVNPQ